MTTSRLAERNSSGLLVRAAWANSARQQEAAEDQHRRDHERAGAEGLEKGVRFRPACAGRARPARRRSGRSPDPRTAASRRRIGRPGWSCRQAAGPPRSRTRRARGRARSEVVQPAPPRWSATPIRMAEASSCAGADAEDQPAHPPEPAERQFQPDREEQQDDAELGERLDRMGVGDRDVVEPGRLLAELAEPERPDQHADQDEADDRADPEAGEGRDDDPGRAEDHERVAKYLRC